MVDQLLGEAPDVESDIQRHEGDENGKSHLPGPHLLLSGFVFFRR